MKSDRFFQYAVFLEGGLGVVALFLGYLFGLNLCRGVKIGVVEILISIGLTLPLLFFYFLSAKIPFESFRTLKRLMYKFFNDYLSSFSILQLGTLSVAAGFGEEFFFRGLLQSGLCEVVGNWSKDTIGFDSGFWSNYRLAAIIIFVSILFGAAHAVTKMYFFLAFLISIYLGIIMVLFDNIIIPIIIHSLYDFLVLLLIRKKVRQISN